MPDIGGRNHFGGRKVVGAAANATVARPPAGSGGQSAAGRGHQSRTAARIRRNNAGIPAAAQATRAGRYRSLFRRHRSPRSPSRRTQTATHPPANQGATSDLAARAIAMAYPIVRPWFAKIIRSRLPHKLHRCRGTPHRTRTSSRTHLTRAQRMSSDRGPLGMTSVTKGGFQRSAGVPGLQQPGSVALRTLFARRFSAVMHKALTCLCVFVLSKNRAITKRGRQQIISRRRNRQRFSTPRSILGLNRYGAFDSPARFRGSPTQGKEDDDAKNGRET